MVQKENYQKIENELRELRFINFDENCLDISIFWKKVSSIKLANNTPAFPTLCEFINNLMALPHSSANVERIFSQINLNKTKIRNSLETNTLAGILYSKYFLKNNSSECFNVNVTNKLLKKKT